jgi:hypothetical protein
MVLKTPTRLFGQQEVFQLCCKVSDLDLSFGEARINLKIELSFIAYVDRIMGVYRVR